MNSSQPRYLIVNADDFGLSAEVSRGIVEAHRSGILTSTSLMVDRPASEYAAALAAEVPELSIGLHLELDGRSAADPDGAVQEQLQRFWTLLGRSPTHIDSHHDVHRDPRVLPHVLEVGRLLAIPVRGQSRVRCFTKFYAQWGGETHCEQVSVDSLLSMLRAEVHAGVTELVCHPGHVDDDLASSYLVEREAELRTLCDPRIKRKLDETDIRLIGFHDLVAGGNDRSRQDVGSS